MTVNELVIDEAAYPVRLFMGGLHVEVRLRRSPQARESRHWFNALHAFALGHHMRTAEVDGVILVRGAGKGVRLSTGGIAHPGVMPTMGRELVLWIGAHDAVDRIRFWPCREIKGYRIVVSGGHSHG